MASIVCKGLPWFTLSLGAIKKKVYSTVFSDIELSSNLADTKEVAWKIV